MAVKLSVAVRNAMLDAIETIIAADAKLRVLSGTMPTNAGDAETGTLLVQLQLPSSWLADAVAGVKSKAGTWSQAVATGGVAGYFRIVNTAGTPTGLQGTIGQGSGDLSLDNTTLAAGQTLTITQFDLTAGNG